MSASLELSCGRIYRDDRFQLNCNSEGVEVLLLDPKLKYQHSFLSGALAQRALQPGQAIVKACNNKQRNILQVLDLTGGWGVDGFTLACHGQCVTLLEHNPVVFAIVDYALARYASVHGYESVSIEMIKANASDYLRATKAHGEYDCIYLDPMFPAHKSSAKPAKEMQILQALTDNLDIEDCFEMALQIAHRRVVVKRPLKAPTLGEQKPDVVYREKTIRFDVYLTR